MSTLNFDVPGISPIGLELIALLNDPDVTAKQIAAQAKLDPAIYGNIIACANSPMYASVNTTTDILASLVRLGQREIKRIVYQVVLRAAFFHELPAVNTLMHRIWMQGLTTNLCMQKCVAAAPQAFELSVEELEHLGCLGLIHNIGYVVLLINFQNRFLDFFTRADQLALSVFFEEERTWFSGFDHFSAGRAVLTHWHFPRSFWEIISQYHLPSADFTGTHPKLHSLLRLARSLIMSTKYAFHPSLPEEFWVTGTDLPAVELDTEAIVADVCESVRSIEEAFA